jgi:hypothetical protein
VKRPTQERAKDVAVAARRFYISNNDVKFPLRAKLHIFVNPTFSQSDEFAPPSARDGWRIPANSADDDWRVTIARKPSGSDAWWTPADYLPKMRKPHMSRPEGGAAGFCASMKEDSSFTNTRTLCQFAALMGSINSSEARFLRVLYSSLRNSRFSRITRRSE